MPPKVYEVESGKKPSAFRVYPNWKCPRCQQWRREPMAKVCFKCRGIALRQAADALEEGL